MLAYLKEALEPKFITPPSMLAKDYRTVFDFLKEFTKVAGPVFIVLEDIEKVFFVVLGDASFFKNAAERLDPILDRCDYKRLNF
ncbi:hypothetical protein HDU81_001984 [Chytriomyces hyalinus]|nr:hypothetical protein HDU81_001984 [Chytriomyces hyalinus]